MNISIIIPCLNEEKFLPSLIKDLKNQSLIPTEILVVDAGSKDQTLSLVKEDDLVKIIHSKPNIGAQRKIGGELAKGDYLFFFDSDVRLSRDFLEKSMEQIKDQRLEIGAFIYTPYFLNKKGEVEKSKFLIQISYSFINTLVYIFQSLSPSGAGSGIFVTKDLFSKTGGFRDDLKFDDIEFIRRASKVGKFKLIKLKLLVSDRRFIRYGVIKTLISYVFLSIFFFFNAFKASEIVEYKFSDYKKK